MKTLIVFLLTTFLFIGCEDLMIDFPTHPYVPKSDSFWKVASPSSQQMNENVINGLGALVDSLQHVKSFLIIRNGKIVHEQYANGATQDSLLNICSVTKRITSSLVGIAIDKSYISGTSAPLSQFFPEINAMGADPKWNDITLYHLLNMISGMDWVEVYDLPVFENTFNNPLPVIFSRGIVNEPGTIFSYNSPGVHLLSYVLERSTHKKVSDFARINLFNQLKINKFEWQKDGNGVVNGGANLHLKARDLAKIGLLYLRNGKWNNCQLISENWIDKSLRTPVILDTLQGSWLPSSLQMESKPGVSCGNTWWTTQYMGETIHYGDGYGGQILLIIPKYDVIVVMNRSENVSIPENIQAFDEFFNKILPLVMVSINK